jgi:hypothetical protein
MIKRYDIRPRRKKSDGDDQPPPPPSTENFANDGE